MTIPHYLSEVLIICTTQIIINYIIYLLNYLLDYKNDQRIASRQKELNISWDRTITPFITIVLNGTK